MLDVPVYNPDGEQIDTMQVDEAAFGGAVNPALLKQAVVAYHDRRRQGSARTRSRSQKQGSGRKLYRQKGTGMARRGARRTVLLRGGGVAFAKGPRGTPKGLPRKMRRAALQSALLAKLQGADVLVVDGLAVEAPKTREVARVLANLGINRSCLLTLAERDRALYLSARNLPDVTVRVAAELNAWDVATRQKLLATRPALEALVAAGAQEVSA